MRRGLGFIVLRKSVVSDNCCIYTFSNIYFTFLFVSKPVNKGGIVSFTCCGVYINIIYVTIDSKSDVEHSTFGMSYLQLLNLNCPLWKCLIQKCPILK